MRKKILTALAFATLAFVGCKKNTPDAVELSDVQISGIILAHLDYTNDTNANGTYVAGSVADPASGVRVYTSINYLNLDETPNGGTGDYKTVVISATTDANGAWTLTVPASNKPYTVTVKTEEFFRDQIQADAFGNNTGTELRRFTNADITVNDVAAGAGSVTTKSVIASDFAVNGTTNDPKETGVVKISGTIRINTMDLPGDTAVNGADSTVYEFPAGTVVTVRIGDNILGSNQYDYFTFTIGTDGTYSIDVPTSPGVTGSVLSVDFYFPEILTNFTNTRPSNPLVNEDKVFTIVGGSPDNLGSFNNGQIIINQDYEYRYASQVNP